MIVPYLKRHANRGHQRVTFYLTPNNVTLKNATTELEHINDPHEWIKLPTDSLLEDDGNLENDLPIYVFYFKKDQLQDCIIGKTGVKKCPVSKIEVGCRGENEFVVYH